MSWYMVIGEGDAFRCPEAGYLDIRYIWERKVIVREGECKVILLSVIKSGSSVACEDGSVGGEHGLLYGIVAVHPIDGKVKRGICDIGDYQRIVIVPAVFGNENRIITISAGIKLYGCRDGAVLTGCGGICIG